MRTLHFGLRVADLTRSLEFYTGLGYEAIGNVPKTESGSLTMLKLPGDEFVSLELVHDPARGSVDPGGLSHLVIKVESMGFLGPTGLPAVQRVADAVELSLDIFGVLSEHALDDDGCFVAAEAAECLDDTLLFPVTPGRVG
jgi:catechol 2,3-dioxygenase-like lactoylglutathione lyase family enzyme